MLLNEMEIFYNVVECNSFSRAAEKLNVSKSFISKRISLLENELKTKLLSRNTRKITLTEAGNAFFIHCDKVINEARKSYQLMDTFQQNPTGTLKLSVPIAFGIHILPSVLTHFMSKYPHIKLDIDCDNRLADVIKDGYDLVIRSAKLDSSSLIAQKLLSLKNIICASPIYLKKHKNTISPDNLDQHSFATYYLTRKSNDIKLIKNGRIQTITIDNILISNQLDLIKQMILNGTCIGILPEFMVTKEIANKTIIRCLNEYELSPSPLYLIYPNRELIPSKVKAFIKMLKSISHGDE